LNPFKKIAGDTAIYGMSSIIGRFLNWWLVPYYSFIFVPEVFGIVTNLYSYVAFFLVLLIYGMETAFFRYASKSDNSEKVYSTSLVSLFITSSLFIILVSTFKGNIASVINYPEHPEYILWLAIILGLDAFTAIPFARLRLNNRPVKFASLKLLGIGFNIGFNLFFLTFCPSIINKYPDSFINILYSPDIGVGYVFISNLLASFITLILLLPEIFRVNLLFDHKLLRRMLNYGFPILIVGLAGMVNQNIDKILIPFLIPDEQNPMFQVGIYGANYKLAVLMNMFIQSFRYAFEPFFFSKGSSMEDTQIYSRIMKYFVIFGLFIFTVMILFIDIIKIIISPEYHEGLKIVPLILMANLFFGIYFTLSLWYKLKDKTRYGAYIALTGAVITVFLNILLIPVIGYTGSAVAVFVCYFVMMVMSYWIGKKHYPVPYDLKRIGIYFLVTAVIYAGSLITQSFSDIFKYSANIILLCIYFVTVFMFERNEMSLININTKDND
jgi:O-antigen/teichoic acid export membrane protein